MPDLIELQGSGSVAVLVEDNEAAASPVVEKPGLVRQASKGSLRDLTRSRGRDYSLDAAVLEYMHEQRMMQRAQVQDIPRFILVPWSNAVVAWEVVSTILLVYTAVFLPIRLAFDDVTDSTWDFTSAASVSDLFIDLFFIFDILRNCRQGVQPPMRHSHARPIPRTAPPRLPLYKPSSHTFSPRS